MTSDLKQQVTQLLMCDLLKDTDDGLFFLIICFQSGLDISKMIIYKRRQEAKQKRREKRAERRAKRQAKREVTYMYMYIKAIDG